jgi:hypothetical protein
VYALLMVGYVAGLHLTLRVDPTKQLPVMLIIVVGWIVFSGVLIGAYPGDSLDIFDYVFRGRMQALWDASPLAVTPAAFRHRRFYNYLTWGDWVDAYGPLWEYASGMVARTVSAVSRRRLANYIVGYRVLAIALTGLCGWLIAIIVRRHSPQHVAAACLAWLWNPLLLISTAVGAHNDGLMLVFILATVLLFQRQRWLLGLLMLGLAAHTKITALLLLPVFGLWLLRQRGWWRTLGISGGALALIIPASWLLYAPYGGWATLPRMLRERHILTYNSLANLAFDMLHGSWGWDVTEARQAAIRGSEVAFLVIAAGLLLLFWRQISHTRSTDDAFLWRAGITITMAYLLVGCFWFQSWYVTWVLVLATLLPASLWTRILLPCFALGALWSNLVTDFLNQDPRHRFTGVQIDMLMVATLLTPLCCALLALLLWRMYQHETRFTRLKRLLATVVRLRQPTRVSS